jgi:hypothetical protein
LRVDVYVGGWREFEAVGVAVLELVRKADLGLEGHAVRYGRVLVRGCRRKQRKNFVLLVGNCCPRFDVPS